MSPHLCQACLANPATIHLTEIQDEVREEQHICESCAAAQGLNNEAFVTNMVDAISRSVSAPNRACPHCGMTFEEFRAKGRFGCPKDYEVFDEALSGLLAKMHSGASRHKGRLPRGQHEVETTVGDRLLQLRRELRDAIKDEKYENAARIRDEIQGIEKAATEQRSWPDPSTH